MLCVFYVCSVRVCETFTICCVYPFFHLAKKNYEFLMCGRDGGVYAMFPLCRCLFCLSKQHKQQQQQQQTLLRKGTSRRGRRQFFIYQFQLSSLGFWEFNPLPPLQYKLLAELLLAEKKDNPKEDYAACNWVSFLALSFISPKLTETDIVPPPSVEGRGEGVKNES